MRSPTGADRQSSRRRYLTLGDQPLPNFPSKDGRVLPFILLDLGDDGRRRYFRLTAADQTRRAQRT